MHESTRLIGMLSLRRFVELVVYWPDLLPAFKPREQTRVHDTSTAWRYSPNPPKSTPRQELVGGYLRPATAPIA